MSSSQATPFPETIAGVRDFLRTIPTQTAKLRYILGLDSVENAPKLANSIVVNCIDTEHYEWDSSKLTEIGINTFASGDLRQHIANPGPNGENLLHQIYYYHFRMLPNAHCINKRFCPGNPENNRFGNTRFATYVQGKAMLEECFYWDVTAGRAQDGKCPTVVIGHALRNDADGLARTVGFEPEAADTVVAVIDTQQMAREMGIYNPAGARNEVGLRDLSAHFDIPYRDSHTAGNDAAYTTFSAIYMALYGRIMPTFTKSVLEVVDDVEKSSRLYSISDHGIPRYCTRCHAANHFLSGCRARLPPCEKCQARRRPEANGKLPDVHWFTKGRKAHRTEDCTWGSS
ncbi:hypothetical protein SLS60_002911 [Paraconiothyrium brasiliense]|uniref:Gfd2/YDR514C-like C-terminal domain-containing protein n=1 Tax=Paraconiothyrium brasiliense TaxID=300254 RepID=A0ABR3RUF6_9PLEO